MCLKTLPELHLIWNSANCTVAVYVHCLLIKTGVLVKPQLYRAQLIVKVALFPWVECHVKLN